MDREVIYFTKGRLRAADSMVESIAQAFKGQPFAKHVQDAVYSLNRADAALDTELAATDNQQSNGAEPSEICPKCSGRGWVTYYKFGHPVKPCKPCKGSGKLRHC